ncbi:hypothetical protein PAHAL_2G253700 [Panicum hallii]|jgi:hypothetical protein|uniref:Uncharacterized protein n=1 Tax=Panicum hallii TaxID=206008 RepID=A0A2S3GZA7_9POAL|nr:hypothetical protein PAHAL_2G253700 [Panicum hallii]
MSTVRALEAVVGCLHHISVDAANKCAYILYPDAQGAQYLRAHYVKVGKEKIFFDLVKNVELLPFGEDHDQHIRIARML